MQIPSELWVMQPIQFSEIMCFALFWLCYACWELPDLRIRPRITRDCRFNKSPAAVAAAQTVNRLCVETVPLDAADDCFDAAMAEV